jgi:hypothetical protein
MFLYNSGPEFAIRFVMLVRWLQKYAGYVLIIALVAAPLAFIAVVAVEGYTVCRQHNLVLKRSGDTDPTHQCTAPILSRLRKMFAPSKFS